MNIKSHLHPQQYHASFTADTGAEWGLVQGHSASHCWSQDCNQPEYRVMYSISSEYTPSAKCVAIFILEQEVLANDII